MVKVLGFFIRFPVINGLNAEVALVGRKVQTVNLVNINSTVGSNPTFSAQPLIKSLQFHHINDKEKDFTISGKTKALEIMKKEVDKCILECSNCHGEIHEELYEKGNSSIVNKIVNK